jgi:hypothetical protein
LLGFIWFYSSESGLFNGLRRFQIKKTGRVLACAQNVSNASFSFAIPSKRVVIREFDLASRKRYSANSEF